MAAVCAQFERAGYAATSLDDLMQVTGLGKGSLYGAFGDKRQLFLRALDVSRDRQVALLREGMRGNGSTLGRLRATLIRLAAPSSAEQAACLLAHGAAELGEDDPDVRERTRGVFAAIEQVVAEALAAAVAEGELSPDLDVPRQARMLLATLQGATVLRHTGLAEDAVIAMVEVAVGNLPRRAAPAPAAG